MDEKPRKWRAALYGALLGVFLPAAFLASFATASMGGDYWDRKGIQAVIPTFFYQFFMFALMLGLPGGIIGGVVGRALASRAGKH
jgi:hypothetical protein